MAIIEEFGLQVEIKVNGSTAAEYKDEEPDVNHDPRIQTTKACHNYVESVDDAEFAIHLRLIPGTNTAQEWISCSQSNALRFSVAFDGGRDVASKLVYQKDSGAGQLKGIYEKENTIFRKFCFAPVSTVDNADKTRVATDMKVARNLGLIRVFVHRVTTKKLDKNADKKRTSSGRDKNFATEGICLAEEALKGKAVSHGTRLSAPIAVDRVQWTHYDTQYTDKVDSPLAVFYFKYRSKEALQQQQIIKRPRSLSLESNLENLSAEEIRNLARERLAQKKDGRTHAAPVKKKDDAEAPKSHRPFKFVKIEGGKKAIDLTEDD